MIRDEDISDTLKSIDELTREKLKSVRLDKYYSESIYVSRFDKDTAVYVIPKRDATLNGSQKWKDTMREFVTDTYQYLKEYYERENSEAGFLLTKGSLDGK